MAPLPKAGSARAARRAAALVKRLDKMNDDVLRLREDFASWDGALYGIQESVLLARSRLVMLEWEIEHFQSPAHRDEVSERRGHEQQAAKGDPTSELWLRNHPA